MTVTSVPAATLRFRGKGGMESTDGSGRFKGGVPRSLGGRASRLAGAHRIEVAKRRRAGRRRGGWRRGVVVVARRSGTGGCRGGRRWRRPDLAGDGRRKGGLAGSLLWIGGAVV